MRRSTLAAGMLAVVIALAGCGGLGPVDEPTDTDTPTRTNTQTQDSPAYEALVFDSGMTDSAVIKGGLVPALGHVGAEHYYATLLTDASATDRFNRSLLPEDAAAFVEETDFETASLVVVQAYPKSSVPDYRVESVTREGDRLDVRINDSSDAGTDDITLETVLLRVDHDGDAPRSAAIETQDGVAFDTDDRIVTTGYDVPEDTGADVRLPLSSPDLSENVAEPKDLTLTSEAESTYEYNVTVTATLSPECRFYEPPCEMPAVPTTVFERTGTLEAGETVTFANLIARYGTYDVLVGVTPVDENGETRTDVFSWHVSEEDGDMTVVIDEEGLSRTTE